MEDDPISRFLYVSPHNKLFSRLFLYLRTLEAILIFYETDHKLLTAIQLNRVLTAQTYKQATAHVGLFLKLLIL